MELSQLGVSYGWNFCWLKSKIRDIAKGGKLLKKENQGLLFSLIFFFLLDNMSLSLSELWGGQLSSDGTYCWCHSLLIMGYFPKQSC